MFNNSNDSYLGKGATFFVHPRNQKRIAIKHFALWMGISFFSDIWFYTSVPSLLAFVLVHSLKIKSNDPVFSRAIFLSNTKSNDATFSRAVFFNRILGDYAKIQHNITKRVYVRKMKKQLSFTIFHILERWFDYQI